MTLFNRCTQLVAVMALSGVTFIAQATVIGETLDADLMQQPVAVNLGSSNLASYFFDNVDSGGTTLDRVSTAGTARVASALSSASVAEPVAYSTGRNAPFIDDNLFAVFDSYDTPAVIPFSDTQSYLALKFELGDGAHFGYADLTGGRLLGYGYQSSANTGIQAGAAIERRPAAAAVVPEPSSLAVLVFGMSLLGFGAATRRRRI